MKRLTCKTSVLLLAVCLLLSFSAPAFGDIWRAPKPDKREMLQKELDENPLPGVSEKPRYYFFFSSSFGFLILRVPHKFSTVSIEGLRNSNPLSSKSDEAVR